MSVSEPVNGKLNGSYRPADECPWPRPFPDGFDKCSVFKAQTFSATDMSDRPLPPMLTCHHLATRSLPNGKVGWYAACEIGDEAARQKLTEIRIN